MSRVGPITLLQVAAGRDVFLFDVQALGTEHLFGGVDDVPRTPLRDARKPRRDQAHVRLPRGQRRAVPSTRGETRGGVRRTTGGRRRASSAIARGDLSRGHAGARSAPVRRRRRRRASLAALDGPAAAREGAEPPITAEAVSRVTEHLKMKVKALYAPDRGGDSGLWALRPIAADARRYAALDAWLLGGARAMRRRVARREWTGRVVRASEARVVEYRDAKEPVLQFRDPERAVAPDI